MVGSNGGEQGGPGSVSDPPVSVVSESPSTATHPGAPAGSRSAWQGRTGSNWLPEQEEGSFSSPARSLLLGAVAPGHLLGSQTPVQRRGQWRAWRGPGAAPSTRVSCFLTWPAACFSRSPQPPQTQSSWRLVPRPLLTRSTLEPLRRGAGVQDTGPQLPAARQLIQAQAAGPLTGWAVAVGTEG